MKKFINILTCLIVAMVAMSCGSKVEKDIKAITGDEFKVCDVKTIGIKKEFYIFTNEYSKVFEKYENACDEWGDWNSLVVKCKVAMETYGTPVFEKMYKENKAVLDSINTKKAEYIEQIKTLKNSRNEGKLYVAKLRGKNEHTGKYLDFNSYQVFAYDTDGSLYPSESDETIQIVYTAYPKAKADIQKAIGDALSSLAN